MPYTTSGSTRTWYEVEGSGPPLVFYVGFLGSLDDWRRDDTRYTDALRDSYTLILLDPRGQGRSDKPHDSRLYTLAHRAADVLAALDDLGIPRAHFWGYSMGARVGFTLAAEAPDRLLSLIAGGADPSDDMGDITDHDLYRWLQHGTEGLVDSWERTLGPLPTPMRTRLLTSEDAEALSASLIALGREPGMDDHLASIDVPALLYKGTHDNPEPVERAAQMMPNADFIGLDGLNHAQAFRRSDLILPHALAFLDRLRQPATADGHR